MNEYKAEKTQEAAGRLLLFMWLQQILVAACGIQFPDQGSNPDPLHWEQGVLATGPPGKSQTSSRMSKHHNIRKILNIDNEICIRGCFPLIPGPQQACQRDLLNEWIFRTVKVCPIYLPSFGCPVEGVCDLDGEMNSEEKTQERPQEAKGSDPLKEELSVFKILCCYTGDMFRLTKQRILKLHVI